MHRRAVAVALAASLAPLTAVAHHADRQPRAEPPPAAPATGAPARRTAIPIPAGVRTVRDVVYARPGTRDLKLDLYLPPQPQPKEGEDAAAITPVPVVVWVHGGGWFSGSKDPCPAVGLTAKGFAAASIQYRFSNEDPFPAQLHDCKGAIRWLRAHAAKYHLDPDRIGVWGASAGGHLVALLGTAGDVKELEGDTGGNLDHSSRVTCVCNWFGPTDLVTILGPNAAELDAESGPGRIAPAGNLVVALLGGWPRDRADLYRLASPLTHITPDDPPFLIMHGDADQLVPLDQSELLEKALEAGKVKTTLHVVKGGRHGPLGAEAIRKVEEFFVEQLAATKKRGAEAGR